MPFTETLERFISRVEQNDHAGAVEEFYMPMLPYKRISLHRELAGMPKSSVNATF